MSQHLGRVLLPARVTLHLRFLYFALSECIMLYPLDIIYTTCVQNGLVRNDSDISQWTCNLYQSSVWRLHDVFERELIHQEISFCEINLCVYWFLGISRFIGKSVKICLHQICFVFLSMQINPFKVFAEFVI